MVRSSGSTLVVTPSSRRTTRSNGTSPLPAFTQTKPSASPSRKRKAATIEVQVPSPSKRVHLVARSPLSRSINAEDIRKQEDIPKPTHLISLFNKLFSHLPVLPPSMSITNLAHHLSTDLSSVRQMVIVSKKTVLKLGVSMGRGRGETVYFPASNPVLMRIARDQVRDEIERWDGSVRYEDCVDRHEVRKTLDGPVIKKEEVAQVKNEADAMDIDMCDAPSIHTIPQALDAATRQRILQERIRNKVPVQLPTRAETQRAIGESKAPLVAQVLQGMLLSGGLATVKKSFSVDEVVDRVCGSVSGMGRAEVESALDVLSEGMKVGGVSVKVVQGMGVRAVVVRRA